MRKSINILVSMLYVIMIVGISVNSHYCGGYLLDTYVYTTPECAFCDRHDTSDPDDCCDDEIRFFAIDMDHSQVLAPFELEPDEYPGLQLQFIELVNIQTRQESKVPFNSNAPPQLLSVDLYQLYQRYTFYG